MITIPVEATRAAEASLAKHLWKGLTEGAHPFKAQCSCGWVADKVDGRYHTAFMEHAANEMIAAVRDILVADERDRLTAVIDDKADASKSKEEFRILKSIANDVRKVSA